MVVWQAGIPHWCKRSCLWIDFVCILEWCVQKEFQISCFIIDNNILYSGYIEGVLPGKEGISWESHLLGAIVGVIVAFLVRNVRDEHEDDESASYEDEKMEEKYFFDRDVFEKKEN